MDNQTLNIRPPLWLPIIVALIAGGMYMGGKLIEARGYQPATITVSGEGKVTAVPDIAQLSFGVQTGPQKTAQAAMEMLEEDMNAIFETVKQQGIEEKDIVTESLYLNPAYDWNEGNQTLRGYEATQSLRVKVRDLDKIGAVLSAVTKNGANQAGGVQFTIDEPDQLQMQARQEAIQDAQEQAQKLAAQLGVRLGDLKGFSEGYGGGVPPMPYMARDMAMAEGSADGMKSVPVPAGEQEIVVNVSLTYEVK